MNSSLSSSSKLNVIDVSLILVSIMVLSEIDYMLAVASLNLRFKIQVSSVPST